MHITYNGHASFTISKEGYSISMDTWVTSAFFGSWHPYPNNEFRVSELLTSDAILLSHEHEDHCDIEFLKKYKRQIFIPKYRTGSLCDKLSSNGISFTEVNPREKISLGPFQIEFVIQSAPAWDDSAIIISDKNASFINLNDLKPSVDDIEYIKKSYPECAFLAYQYSGASWHPMVYETLSKESKMEISAKKILNKYKHTLGLIEEFQPEFIIPSAGPPCFLFDEHIDLNNGETAVFPDLKSYKLFLDAQNINAVALYMSPGDTITSDKDAKYDSSLRSAERLMGRKELILSMKAAKGIRDYTSAATDAEVVSDGEIVQYFDAVFKNTAPFRYMVRYWVHYEVFSKTKKTDIFVNYKTAKVLINTHSEEVLDFGYKFTLPVRSFNKVIRRQATWEEVFLSLQFTMQQYIESHDENFFTLHKFCHTDYLQKYLIYYKSSFKSETFRREHNGKTYVIQKFCPHAMGDLSKGEIINDHIVCPNHGWAYCLKDGKSTNSDLKIKILETENND